VNDFIALINHIKTRRKTMENSKIENQFRDDEIALIRHFDKQREW